MSAARRHRRAGIVAAVGLVLLAVVVFVKQSPFAGGQTVHAVVTTATQLKEGSEVRIAGTRVGRVESIGAGPRGTSALRMRIEDGGGPVKRDATLTVKPRLILEGNAYVDMRPGSPAAPALPDGGTIPLRNTAVSVQLDQALNVFDLSTRTALFRSVRELATGLDRPRPAAPVGAEGLRRSIREFGAALPPAARVARALRGTESGDLGRAVRHTGDVTEQLATNPAALADLVTNFNRVAGALAARDRELAATIVGFERVLRAAPEPLRTLDAALPSLTRAGHRLRPALRAAPRSLTKANRLLDQVDAVSRPAELPALLTHLAPATAELPRLQRRLTALFEQSRPVTDCIASHVVPTLNMKIQDGPHTTGDPVYLDLMHLFTGLSGFSSAVDANGGTIRLGVTTSERSVNTLVPGLGRVVANTPNASGVRPTWLGYGKNPPFRPDQSCARQKLPDLSARSGAAPAWARGGGP